MVCTGLTGHAEAVEVTYDPAAVSLEHILDEFWKLDAPRAPEMFHGGQYRSAIFYYSAEQGAEVRKLLAKIEGKLGRKVFTEISPVSTFYKAEEYHQNYYKKNHVQACHR